MNEATMNESNDLTAMEFLLAAIANLVKNSQMIFFLNKSKTIIDYRLHRSIYDNFNTMFKLLCRQEPVILAVLLPLFLIVTLI